MIVHMWEGDTGLMAERALCGRWRDEGEPPVTTDDPQRVTCRVCKDMNEGVVHDRTREEEVQSAMETALGDLTKKLYWPWVAYTLANEVGRLTDLLGEPETESSPRDVGPACSPKSSTGSND